MSPSVVKQTVWYFQSLKFYVSVRLKKELERRSAKIGRDLSELRENGVAGTLDEARERIKSFQQLGVSRMYFQVLDEDDLDHVSLLSELLDEFTEVEENA